MQELLQKKGKSSIQCKDSTDNSSKVIILFHKCNFLGFVNVFHSRLGYIPKNLGRRRRNGRTASLNLMSQLSQGVLDFQVNILSYKMCNLALFDFYMKNNLQHYSTLCKTLVPRLTNKSSEYSNQNQLAPNKQSFASLMFARLYFRKRLAFLRLENLISRH